MEPRILSIVLLCFGICAASHHEHTIPVEGYETELQDLGQHVEVPETPVKVIKITKTVAVKIPVPYPVKVVEKVPYPVHVNKPYPVPVPQIVHAPHTPKTHEQALGGIHGFHGNIHFPLSHQHLAGRGQGNHGNEYPNVLEQQEADGGHAYHGTDDGSYQVQDNSEHNESPSYNGPFYSGYAPNNQNNYHRSSELEGNDAIQSHNYHSQGDDN